MCAAAEAMKISGVCFAINEKCKSGEIDKAGSISKCGDGLLRSYLFEAANVLLSRNARSSKLKTWGLALASRIGMRRAKVAVARKLSVIMHRVWRDERDFGGVSPNPRKFRQVKFSPATIASKSITCPLSRKV
jgi:hypothetical protein